MTANYPDFFNDVFGPVMQPGSSSHTAAPCRLGLLARSFLGERPAEARFIMDTEGSFAGTFGIMNEDRGMLSGVLGLGPEDERIYQAFDIAEREGLRYSYVFDRMKESSHLNAIKIILKGGSGKTAELVGDSTGGGMVCIKKLDGFKVNFIGDSYVLLIFSTLAKTQQQSLTRMTGGYLASETITDKQRTLTYCKFSERPDKARIKALFPDIKTELLDPVLPVVFRSSRKAQLFRSVSEWRHIASERGISMSRAAVEYEKASSLWTEEKILEYMKNLKNILYRQINAAYEAPREDEPAAFERRDSGLWSDYRKSSEALSGPVLGNVIGRTIGVNQKTKGIPIVPGPMGTGGGYLFSALFSVKEAYGCSEDALLRGLFVAAGIGAISYTHTSPTGEVVGCGGECGVCCAMAAGAIVEMCGGDGYQIENAASLALQAFIGLPCDPVTGGYEAPCFSRVIAASCMAVVYADLALAGSKAVIPYDEMVQALDRVGKGMPPELLCTSRGGCCTTPTAKCCEAEFKKAGQQR
jgi:L-serine dehydratase